jgi:hypothetical protein
MSDEESLREDGRREDADRRARKHVCHLVNSATPEPPECAACELEAKEEEEREPTFEDLHGREHVLRDDCWCNPTIKGHWVEHNTTFLEIRGAVLDPVI